MVLYNVNRIEKLFLSQEVKASFVAMVTILARQPQFHPVRCDCLPSLAMLPH